MKVCTIGTGYVGLVQGAGLAETGQTVVCCDIDKEKIARLNRGEIPIYEPGLDDVVARCVAAGRLTFSDKVAETIADSDVIFIAVGTPPRADGGADLTAVDRVVETVVQHATREVILAVKSTVPVGTNARIKRIAAGSKYPIHAVSNPEFLKEGDAINDFMRPDRIIIGCEANDTLARDTMSRLYHPLCLDKDRIVWMDPASAELSKYVANSMLAMRISFMNEISQLCEKVGADVHNVRLGVGSDSRIGPKFLYAGPGYGGSCFPKDVSALVHTAREYGLELETASATERANIRQKGVVVRKLKQHFDGDVRGKKVMVWGIAFKPRTDDIRDAPSLTVMDALVADGAHVFAHDPEGAAAGRARYGNKITIVDDQYEGAKDADALVLMTEWRQYQNPDFDKLKASMRRPLLIDARNIWSGYGLRKRGFTYEGIGVHGS